MSHSSTSGILKALAELGEGVWPWYFLLRQVGTLPLVAACSFFLQSLISFGPSCWETAGRMVPCVADDDLACRPVQR
jgi:hypothetical protein